MVNNLKELTALKKAKFIRKMTRSNNQVYFFDLEDFKIAFWESAKKNNKNIEFVEFSEQINKENQKVFFAEYFDKDKNSKEPLQFTNKNLNDFEKLIASQSEIVEVTFRSKDYFYTFEKDQEKRKVFGEVLTNDNLTENGFKITTFSGVDIFYYLIN